MNEPANARLLAAALTIAETHPQRIPYPPTVEGVKGVYGDITNGQRMAYYLAPEIREGMSAMAGGFMRHGRISPKLRELVIVRVGYLTDSAYEVIQHVSLARKLGVTDAALDALRYVDPAGLDAQDHAAIRLVDEVMQQVRPSDTTLQLARAHHSDAAIIEIVMVAGFWRMLAGKLETAGVPLDSTRIGEEGIAPEGLDPVQHPT